MNKPKKQPRDVNQLAKSIVEAATSDKKENVKPKEKTKKPRKKK